MLSHPVSILRENKRTLLDVKQMSPGGQLGVMLEGTNKRLPYLSIKLKDQHQNYISQAVYISQPY